MRNLSSIFSFKHRDPLAAVVLFALIVLGVEVVLGRLPDPKWPDAFVPTLSLPERAPEVQVMGDSMAVEGVVTTNLAAELPGHPTVWSLAKRGTGPEFTYFMLRRELARGVSPKSILYVPSPHTFASDRMVLLAGAFCTWPEIGEIAREGIAPIDLLYGIFCKLSFTLRNREELGEILRGKRPGQVALRVFTKTADAQSPKRMVYGEKGMPPMYKNNFKVRDFNRVFFEKFLALARERNIPVIWATTPILPVIYKTRKGLGYEENYFLFLEEMNRRYGVEILQKEFMVYGDDLFKDYTHLNHEGAEQFTKFLAEKMAADSTLFKR